MSINHGAGECLIANVFIQSLIGLLGTTESEPSLN